MANISEMKKGMLYIYIYNYIYNHKKINCCKNHLDSDAPLTLEFV